ncbi:ankyrin repeat domain-containing protein 40-like isoform X2 [Oratosquilla oratoria]|uniref:ankyrin repeat domain-containing protein 40-like isoform X2 n=1 Tax=Oratosquilla oratoria TaxID=337810 RepID=UPI003F76401A
MDNRRLDVPALGGICRMDPVKQSEEKFREACCYGDTEALTSLVNKGININCKHNINGWTGLHWACKRENVETVRWLLANGADINITNSQNQVAAQLTSNPQILNLLGVDPNSVSPVTSVASPPITPNYLANPPLDYKVDVSSNPSKPSAPSIPFSNQVSNVSKWPATSVASQSQMVNGIQEHVRNNSISSGNSGPVSHSTSPAKQMLLDTEIILKIRVASDDPDFIEVDLKRAELTYGYLLTVCSRELAINAQHVERIRKLPNTRLRNDKDVKRLKDFEELEVVLTTKKSSTQNFDTIPSTRIPFHGN